MKCYACSKEQVTKATKRGLERLPQSWHRLVDRTYCKVCWADRYVLRAVTFAVSGPVGAEWADLRVALSACWADSTGLANWAVNELAKADVTRSPGDAKMPSLPRIYLYPAARRRFPAMSPTALNAVLHAAEGRYRKARLETVWRSAASLPTYRYPCPYPVHNQAWHAAWLEYRGTDGQVARVPTVRVTLHGTAFVLRLAGGPGFRRQLAGFGQITDGQAIQGELSLYRVRAHAGDHRSGVTDRTPGGGQRVSYRVMAKLVAWLPRPERARGDGILFVHTDPNAFLVAEMDGRAPWIVNADHVRRRVAAHNAYLQRVAEDTKREKRLPARQRRLIDEAREKRCAKHRDRVGSFIKECCSWLTNYAVRCGVAEVVYDDGMQAYLERFPWCAVKERLKVKLDECGIRLTVAESAKTKGE